MLNDREMVVTIERLLRDDLPTDVVLWGRSMLPTIWPGSRAHVCPCDPADLVLGDVVVVRQGHTLLAHRLIALREGRWICQGDFFDEPDAAVEADQILGRIASLHLGGYSLHPPPKVRRSVNHALLRITPELRAVSRLAISALRQGTQRANRSPVLRRARAYFQPWFISAARSEHLPAVKRALLFRGVRPSRPLVESWRACVRRDQDVGLLALHERTSAVLGYARVHRSGETWRHRVGIFDLWVHPFHRGRGIATALLEEAIRSITQTPGLADAVEVMADVAASGGPAHRAFLRNGFEHTEERSVSSEHVRLLRRM